MVFSVSATRSEAQSVSQSTAPSASAPRLDRIEVQRFEQSYEAWVQSIVQHVLPSTATSILVDLTYSNNPDTLQSYEEHRAANHLPGLPDVLDNNTSANPIENPLFELVTAQNIKVIFEEQPSDDQIRVVKEILGAKLNLDSTHGDQISFDHLNRNTTATARAWSVVKKTARSSTSMIVLAFLVVAFVLVRKNRIASELRAMGEVEINALYSKVNPIKSIFGANPKTLISVIRRQETDFLVQAMAHAPIVFNQIILQVFEEADRKNLFEAFQAERLNVSSKKSRYSQLLLAAKIHDEVKIEALQQIDLLNEVSGKVNEQRLIMQKSLQQLKALYGSGDAAVAKQGQGVNHEASI